CYGEGGLGWQSRSQNFFTSAEV
ncbi:hypothetical protein LCGC14_0832200, partial [marine sediment metagenome]